MNTKNSLFEYLTKLSDDQINDIIDNFNNYDERLTPLQSYINKNQPVVIKAINLISYVIHDNNQIKRLLFLIIRQRLRYLLPAEFEDLIFQLEIPSHIMNRGQNQEFQTNQIIDMYSKSDRLLELFNNIRIIFKI